MEFKKEVYIIKDKDGKYLEGGSWGTGTKPVFSSDIEKAKTWKTISGAEDQYEWLKSHRPKSNFYAVKAVKTQVVAMEPLDTYDCLNAIGIKDKIEAKQPFRTLTDFSISRMPRHLYRNGFKPTDKSESVWSNNSLVLTHDRTTGIMELKNNEVR